MGPWERGGSDGDPGKGWHGAHGTLVEQGSMEGVESEEGLGSETQSTGSRREKVAVVTRHRVSEGFRNTW